LPARPPPFGREGGGKSTPRALWGWICWKTRGWKRREGAGGEEEEEEEVEVGVGEAEAEAEAEEEEGEGTMSWEVWAGERRLWNRGTRIWKGR
jgi:hypothetical protein